MSLLLQLFVASVALAEANLEVLHVNVQKSLENLGATLGTYQAIACLTPESTEHLAGFQAGATQVATSLKSQYKDYVGFVTKPMLGNGKCDGGFSSVSYESERRRARSAHMVWQVQNLEWQFGGAMTANFTAAHIDMPDQSAEQECSSAGSDLYDLVQDQGDTAFNAMVSFQAGVSDVESRFRQYAQRNTTLQDDCGSMPSDMSKVLLAGPGQSAIGVVLGGASQNPASTITGDASKKSLPNPGATEKLAAGRSPASADGGANPSATSNFTSAGAVAISGGGEVSAAGAGTPSREANAHADKEAILNGAAQITGSTAINGRSEEMAVQNLLHAGASSAAGGAANAGAVGSEGGALEAMIATQRSSAAAAGGSGANGFQAANGSDSGRLALADGVNPLYRMNAGAQLAPMALGSPDSSLFERVHLVLRHRPQLLKTGRSF